jgi:hypothetical protein
VCTHVTEKVCKSVHEVPVKSKAGLLEKGSFLKGLLEQKLHDKVELLHEKGALSEKGGQVPIL